MKRFKKIYVEITNVCNLACSFCPPTRRAPSFMSTDDFAFILGQIKPYTDYVYLHVKGEPLMHPKLLKIFDLCHEMGVRVNLTTNGTLIQKVQDSMMNKPALRQINFSLHSMASVGTDMANIDYIRDIIAFTKKARAHSDIIITFRLWNLDGTSTQKSSNDCNTEFLKIIEKEFDLDFKIQDFVHVHRGIKIADRLYINQDRQFKWPDMNEEADDGKGFCYGLRDQVAILADGTVVPCCLDGEGVIKLGNVKHASFSEIINGERAMALYNAFSERYAIEELCKKCGYRTKF